MAKPLGIVDAIDVLSRLGELASEIVLIGGQALNLWADRYCNHAALRALEGPIPSKDIDFCGTQDQVRSCADALHGRAQYQSTEALSRCIGIVRYLDAEQDERAIDFLSVPYGLEGEPLKDMSFPAIVSDRDGREVRLLVMHPLHCLMSRVANIADIEAYQTEHGAQQLRASIACMQAFFDERLSLGETKTAAKLIEKLFVFCEKSSYAQTVFTRDRIEPFDAVPSDHVNLPSKFKTTRYPQMQGRIARRRAASRQ